MHGRLKVRTSAEEALRKKKEQEEKAKAFRMGMSLIMNKKVAGELDDELMQLTRKILASNPDIATLWNLRRMHLEKLRTSDEAQNLFDNDLGFTEMCLQVNPKSYCAWHHRCWILENCPDPNWQKEVDLCTKYLKLDERNFHCWDYRRYVAGKAGVSLASELEFCTEKIQKNFSNYSSWHYRSKLLPALYPNEEDPSHPISEDKLREELELVLTAAFTDPNDSSAWFYQRWLLGYSEPALDIASFRMNLRQKLAVITFTRPVNLKHKCAKLSFDFDSELDQSQWISASPEDSYSVCWIWEGFCIQLPKQTVYEITFVDEDAKSYILPAQRLDEVTLLGIRKPKFGHEFGDAVLDVLKTQLESCQQLLEFEPDSKWTLLTAALLLKTIDRHNNHDKVLEYLEKLKTVDPMRCGYYKDLMNKWNVEHRLERWINAGDPNARLDLTELELDRLMYEQYLAVAELVDLTGNVLSSLRKFNHLVFCRELLLTTSEAVTVEAEPTIRQVCRSLETLIMD